MDLAAEHMEVVGRGGAVDDLPVGLLDLRAHLLLHRRHLKRPRMSDGTRARERAIERDRECVCVFCVYSIAPYPCTVLSVFCLVFVVG